MRSLDQNWLAFKEVSNVVSQYIILLLVVYFVEVCSCLLALYSEKKREKIISNDLAMMLPLSLHP
jgi:hypothetical protein